jgi:aminoglycoside/choline kinase family phosphotransferase
MIKVCRARYNRKVKEFPIDSNALAWCNAHVPGPVRQVTPLRVEASHRNFYRLSTSTGSFVLMVSPPALERNDQFITLAEVFLTHGVPVPELYAAHRGFGYVLMADLGTQDYEQVYRGPQRDQALTAALDTLQTLGRVRDSHVEPYTVDRFTTELGLFDEWFLHGLLKQPGNNPGTSEYHKLIEATQAQPQCCVHRDYHCRNLLWHAGTLGIVDFQDALHGPRLYDVASLLRDCYYVFTEAEVDRWLDYFIRQSPDLNGERRETVKRWFDFTAIQRQLKAIGIFARLHLRDGKSSHLDHILPVLGRVTALCSQYTELGPLTTQLSECATPAGLVLEELSA